MQATIRNGAAASAMNENMHAAPPRPAARRGPITMGLVWVSMVASFPSVLIGLSWYKQGFKLPEVLWSLVLCMGLLLAYSIPMCLLAAKTGLSFKLLCHKFFGAGYSRMLTGCVIFLYLGWYAVVCLLMADACCGLGGLGKEHLALIAFCFSFAMAFNNFFGFSGVANFARFIGAPAVICWITYLFANVAPTAPAFMVQTPGAVSLPLVFCGVAQSIVGFVIWGNEADYWRNSTTGKRGISLALFSALAIGACIFPLTGWLVGAGTGITDPMLATDHLNRVAFGGAGIIAILFLAAQYFAANDSNLYAFAHAVESFTSITHRKTVFLLAVVAGALAAGLAVSGTQSALESVCSLNGVMLPVASLIVVTEGFIIGRICQRRKLDVPRAGRSAVIAWASGMGLGVLTSGIIPGTSDLHVGLPILEAWLLAFVVFMILRLIDISSAERTAIAE